MVPAFIPDGFTRQELSGVRKLIELVRSYDQIFGQKTPSQSETPLAEKLDMIVTSVGPAERPLGFGQGVLFETGRITFEELQKLVIGDVGGVCFARPDLSKTDSQTLARVNERWTGLRREHLLACAARARRSPDPFDGPPGVVVISGGRARARVIYELVKLGLINHLIIDDELENELESITEA
jgi:DNA-binding transcriptional regulator LsrR (DeoR family)